MLCGTYKAKRPISAITEIGLLLVGGSVPNPLVTADAGGLDMRNLCRFRRKLDDKCRTRFLFTFNLNGSFVKLDDLFCDGKS